MAYIETRTEYSDIRVILGNHKLTTPPGQLPPRCTGVMLESVSGDSMWVCGEVRKPSRQYTGLIKEARKRYLHLVPAEPEYPEYPDFLKIDYYLGEVIDRDNNSLQPILKTALALLIPGIVLPILSTEIKEESRFYQWLLKENRKFTEYKEDEGYHSFRNLCMTYRTLELARRQRGVGVERPHLALVVGAAHIDIVDNLRLSQAELLDRIAKHPLRDKMRYLDVIYGVRYQEGEWSFSSPDLLT